MQNAFHQRRLQRTTALATLLILCSPVLFASLATAQTISQPNANEIKRKLFVPMDALEVLLDGNSNRVMLTKSEYATLLKSAETRKIERAPVDSAILLANFNGRVMQDVAVITGTMVVESLNDGFIQIPLAMSGVAIREASLDGKPANLWRKPNGETVLLVSGKGKKKPDP